MQRVLISGATRGIGLAMSHFFAAQGWQVIGCSRSPASCDALQATLGTPHSITPLDVSDDHAVQAWAKQALTAHGPPDLLLNNAALIARTAPLWELSAAETDPVIEVNIKGVINLIRHFLPAMIARRHGIVINISSGWGRSTSPDVAVYCATKYAIEGLTAALAQELPPGMAAIALNPGIIATDMLKSCFGNEAAAYPTPEHWIRSAGPFLLSITPAQNGQALTVPAP